MVNAFSDLSGFYAFISGLWSAFPSGIQLFIIGVFGIFVVFGVFRMVLR